MRSEPFAEAGEVLVGVAELLVEAADLEIIRPDLEVDLPDAEPHHARFDRMHQGGSDSLLLQGRVDRQVVDPSPPTVVGTHHCPNNLLVPDGYEEERTVPATLLGDFVLQVQPRTCDP